jgi:hypothetical protein
LIVNPSKGRTFVSSIVLRGLLCASWIAVTACAKDVDLNDDVGENAGGGGGANLLRDEPEGAFASINIKPDSSCVYSPDGASIGSGLYDIAEGGHSGSRGCSQPYRANFLVESDAHESVLFQQATVTLRTIGNELLAFDGQEEDLVNPFEVTTSGRVDGETGEGVVQVTAIPVRYAALLFDFVGSEIIVDARLEGRTPSDRTIRTQTVRFSVEICDGCLSRCSSLLTELMLHRADFAMDACDDNAGADGRICWDPEC